MQNSLVVLQDIVSACQKTEQLAQARYECSVVASARTDDHKRVADMMLWSYTLRPTYSTLVLAGKQLY